jgi:hypothetical protein
VEVWGGDDAACASPRRGCVGAQAVMPVVIAEHSPRLRYNAFRSNTSSAGWKGWMLIALP